MKLNSINIGHKGDRARQRKCLIVGSLQSDPRSQRETLWQLCSPKTCKTKISGLFIAIGSWPHSWSQGHDNPCESFENYAGPQGNQVRWNRRNRWEWSGNQKGSVQDLAGLFLWAVERPWRKDSVSSAFEKREPIIMSRPEEIRTREPVSLMSIW